MKKRKIDPNQKMRQEKRKFENKQIKKKNEKLKEEVIRGKQYTL